MRSIQKMIKNNLENSVTCATRNTLLQRMHHRRLSLPSEIKINSAPFPLAITKEPLKLQLPQLVIDWFTISLNEGHIQPSQPDVGRLEGWPMRPYFKNSLYVDFECWCLKSGIQTYLIPSKELFYQATDTIFESIADNKYQFPDLTICRQRFSKLLKEVKYDQS